jgi:hypothetical protein
MRLNREEWSAVIGSALLVAGLAVLGAYLATEQALTSVGKAVVFESDIIGTGANTLSFSTSSDYAIAFWVLAGIVAGMAVIYAIAGLTRRRRLAGAELAPVETLRPAQEEESRRKAA